MGEHTAPVLRTINEVVLVGKMTVYGSQAQAVEGIPRQWSDFLDHHPRLDKRCDFLGASPCTADGRLHYLAGVAQEDWDGSTDGELVTLVAGEYAVVWVADAAQLRETWTWLLGSWLPASGRREKNAPEFEKYAAISKSGVPVGPIELWIPLEAPSTN